MKNMTYLYMMLFFLVACDKEEPTPMPPIVQPKVFEKVWSTRIYEAPLENVGSDNAYLYKDWYIVTGDNWSHIDPSLYAYDTKTGKLAWKWTQTGRYQQPGHNLVGKDNILILSDSEGILAFDIETQQLLWEHIHTDRQPIPFLGGTGQLPIYGNFVYKLLSLDNFYGPESIYRYNINTGIEERIHTFQLEPDFKSPNLSPPTFWVNPITNDTLMFLVNSRGRVDLAPEESPTDLVAYNLTKRKIEWTLEEFTPWGTNTLYPPSVYNNTVMVAGDWSIYGVDILTGTVKWRTQFPNLPWVGNFVTTKHLVAGDRVYVNSGLFSVACLNAENGSILWHNKNAAANCSPNMLYNNDMLIIGSFGLGSVVIMDGLNGNVIHSERGERTYYTDVLYDKATDMYFVQDFAQAVGFKINKPR
jgi:outer membrane protein assembly factor BamB